MTGIKTDGNEGRDVTIDYKGKSYARYPIETHFIEIGEELVDILDKYAKPTLQEGDVLCIATKIVSITKELVVHKDEVKTTPLAKLIVKFVRKWPNDIGYSNPRKMQVAINMVGYPRIVLAMIGGAIMKLFGKPGYFYKIAGNRINAIDGFTVGFTDKPIFENYAFLPPSEEEGDAIADEIEQQYGVATVILDGNNIDNNVMGMSKKAKERFSIPEFMEIAKGNPQGQEDDGNNTPLLVVREV